MADAKREEGPARIVAALAITGLLSGLTLVGVYVGTLPRIQRNQAEALRAAVFRVLPGTERVSAFVLRHGALAPYDGPENAPPPAGAVFAGYRADGSLAGWAVPADGPGFMDTIGLLYGFDPARRAIVGLQVLESRETPGLGDKIQYDPAFLANFEALAVEPAIVPVKRGKKAQANEVDCITGATISSEAVVGILNRSTATWVPLLDTGGEVARRDD